MSIADHEVPVVERIAEGEWLSQNVGLSLPDEETLAAQFEWEPFSRRSVATSKIIVRGPDSAWLNPVLSQVNTLLSLKDNWDSYGAKALSRPRVIQALKLLKDIMQDHTPSPSIVPTAVGSVQLEWHTAGIDLELAVIGDNTYSVSFDDHETGDVWEEVLSTDLSRLVEAIGKLSRVQQAASAGNHG